MKVLSVIAICVLISVSAIGQGNMIENGGFDEIEKKIKEGGAIALATGWTSPTATPADLFNKEAKAEEFGAPKNMYGDAEPLNGEGYAGIMVYSYKDEAPRQFLQARLRYPMEEEKVYCVKMNVMLSMLAKFSSNNLGIYISADPVTSEQIEEYTIQPQIIHSQNKIFDEQFDWEAICQSYIAKGDERYITIGNFGPTDMTQAEKVKKPKGVTGNQARGAYYYIDDVSVLNMAGVDECDCELDPGGKSLQVVYSKNVSTEMEVDASQDIEMTRIYFDDMSSDLNARALTDVEKVAALLKENPAYKVKITGHTDPVEESKVTGDVSLNRANMVKSKLLELGVPENKLLVVGVQDFEPVTQDASVAGQAQNRRVVFSVISKE